MSTKDSGGPAFPRDHRHDGHNGMDLRDWFAGMAMQGMLVSKHDHPMRGYEGWREEFAREALRFADAMIAERAK